MKRYSYAKVSLSKLFIRKIMFQYLNKTHLMLAISIEYLTFNLLKFVSVAV